jgi:hypothetical protein
MSGTIKQKVVIVEGGDTTENHQENVNKAIENDLLHGYEVIQATTAIDGAARLGTFLITTVLLSRLS